MSDRLYEVNAIKYFHYILAICGIVLTKDILMEVQTVF